tara:strand:+ start:10605 stop:11048 length:444 start_codon:yes stop_codon:yes gene_type:complete
MKASHSLIVLFDVLFLFLFAGLLAPAPGISVISKGEPIGVGTYTRSNGEGIYLSAGYTQIDEKDLGSFFTLPCNRLSSCGGLNEEGLIYGDLAEEISVIALLACISEPSSCGNVTFVVSNGTVDLDQSVRRTPSLAAIKGVPPVPTP